MMYLFSWVVQHAKRTFSSSDFPSIIDRVTSYLTKHVAEVSSVKKVVPQPLLWGKVITSNATEVILHVLSSNTRSTLPLRAGVRKGAYFLITPHNMTYRWAEGRDFGDEGTYLLPAMHYKKEMGIPAEEYLIEIDNKSLGGRGDLLSHRGLMRELTIPLQTTLRDEKKITYAQSVFSSNPSMNLTITHPKVVGLSVCQLPEVFEKPTTVAFARFLSLIGQRSRSLLIDATNVVMADIGHPIHVFDYKALGNTLTVRAGINDPLTLIDGETVTCPPDSVVMTNEKDTAVSLPGIRGGKETALQETSTGITIEAIAYEKGFFQPMAAGWYERNSTLKTDAARRFEKDPSFSGALLAIKRFLCIIAPFYRSLKKQPIAIMTKISQNIGETTVPFLPALFNEYAGEQVKKSTILSRIKKIGFSLKNKNQVLIPWWRSDCTIPETIVEEFLRLTGYDTLLRCPPHLPCQGNDTGRKDSLIKLMSTTILEADEKVNYQLITREQIKRYTHAHYSFSPFSLRGNDERVIIPSLFFHLAENIATMVQKKREVIRLFEVGRRADKESIPEETVAHGYLSYTPTPTDSFFFDEKKRIKKFFSSLSLPLFFEKKESLLPFFSPYTANICEKKEENTLAIVGSMGIIDPEISYRILRTKGALYYSEITAITPELFLHDAPKKFETFFDRSLVLEKTTSVNSLIMTLRQRIALDDTKISIRCIDYFSREDRMRTVTLRIATQREDRPAIELLIKELLEHLGIAAT